jgi:hypothetical protein
MATQARAPDVGVSLSEVTIMDKTGRAEITKGKPGPGLKLARTGGL